MLLKQVLELFELLDTPQACGATIEKLMLERGAVGVKVVEGFATGFDVVDK